MKNNSIVDASNPSNVIHSAGDYTLPKVRSNLTTTFAASPFSIQRESQIHWQVKVTSPMRRSSAMTIRRQPTYLDLYATYQLASNVKVSAGMNNTFDTAPPQTATTYTVPRPLRCLGTLLLPATISEAVGG